MSLSSEFASTVSELAARELAKKRNKYWLRRYMLFSKISDGIQMDSDMYFMATPEWLAKKQALAISRLCGKGACTVVDGYSGVGGNSIQFALAGHAVTAIELEPIRTAMAMNNARVYGVRTGIRYVCADLFEELRNGKPSSVDVVYMSPPWGGPKYALRPFDVEADMHVPMSYMLRATKAITRNVAIYLPRNSSVEQIESVGHRLGYIVRAEMERHHTGWVPGMTVYFSARTVSPMRTLKPDTPTLQRRSSKPMTDITNWRHRSE